MIGNLSLESITNIFTPVAFGMERVEKKKEPNAFSEVVFSQRNIFLKVFSFWTSSYINLTKRKVQLKEFKESLSKCSPDDKTACEENIKEYTREILLGHIEVFLNFLFLLVFLAALFLSYFGYLYLMEKNKTREKSDSVTEPTEALDPTKNNEQEEEMQEANAAA